MTGTKPKPFEISKCDVWESWKLVKSNKGAAGVDQQTIADFEQELQSNLYKIWNRMSSGTYFPPPVRTVMIPKASGGERPLGIPTVADRVAQMVAKRYLEPLMEPLFHPDSYGYRPGKSAHDALVTARKRCWLQAPAQSEDGSITARLKGTPQGGVISPLLANLFLHHAFDQWMAAEHAGIPFERYADDILVHCASLTQAQFIRERIAARLAACKLEIHPEKTFAEEELPPAKRAEYLAHLHVESVRLSGLVEDVLDLARLTRGVSPDRSGPVAPGIGRVASPDWPSNHW